MRVQLHADVAVDGDGEYAAFAAWWLRRLRQAHSEFSGLTDAQIDGLLCGMSGGQHVGEVTFEDLPMGVGFPTMERAIRGQGGGLVAGWASGPAGDHPPRVSVDASVHESGLQWVRADCTVWFGADAAEQTIVGVEDALQAMLVDVVERWNPSFANLTDDSQGGIPHGMALESAIPRSPAADVIARRLLRTYSWTTFVCPEISEQLGGAARMIASRVFWQVREAGGGLILRATEHLADYAGPRVRAVREMLELAMRSGEYVGPDPLTSGLRIAWDDGRDGPFDYGTLQSAYLRASRNGRWVVVHG